MRASLSTSNFKRKRFIYIRLIVFTAIVSILLMYIGEHFEYISNKNQMSTYAKQSLDTFYAEKKKVDLIFLGSSHSYCTFDPEYFDQNTNLYSYQLGTPLQHADTSYYMMREVLEYKKPKIVVFEIYWDMIDDSFELKQADMFLSAIKNINLKDEYIKNVFPLNEKLKYFFKPVRYQQDAIQYYNTQLVDFVEKHKVNQSLSKQTYKEFYRDRGFLYTEKEIQEEEFKTTNQFRDMDYSKWTINHIQKGYIENLVKLCNKNNIKIYFVTAPIANVSMKYIKNYDNIHRQVDTLAKKLNVPYIDYNIINQEQKLLSNIDFSDDAHLNIKGAVIVQEHFVNWLKNIERSNFE